MRMKVLGLEKNGTYWNILNGINLAGGSSDFSLPSALSKATDKGASYTVLVRQRAGPGHGPGPLVALMFTCSHQVSGLHAVEHSSQELLL